MAKLNYPKSHLLYTLSEKHLVIKDFLSSGLTKEAICIKYFGKGDHGELICWMRDLGYPVEMRKKRIKLVSNNKFMSKKKNYSEFEKEDFETLQLKKRVIELEKQLKDAEMKAIAFSTMVDIAEKEFNIPIRKKFNTKP